MDFHVRPSQNILVSLFDTRTERERFGARVDYIGIFFEDAMKTQSSLLRLMVRTLTK
jgi:hypothetical protein